MRRIGELRDISYTHENVRPAQVVRVIRPSRLDAGIAVTYMVFPADAAVVNLRRNEAILKGEFGARGESHSQFFVTSFIFGVVDLVLPGQTIEMESESSP